MLLFIAHYSSAISCLYVGVIEGLDDVGWADVPIVAMETEGAASFAAAMAAGKVVSIPDITR